MYIHIYFGKWSYGVKAKGGSTVVLLASAFERSASSSLKRSGRADVRIPLTRGTNLYSVNCTSYCSYRSKFIWC